MKKYVVVYLAVDGDPEVFGDFDNYNDACIWMKKDYDNALNESGYEEYEDITYCYENNAVIDNYGSWKVVEKRNP